MNGALVFASEINALLSLQPPFNPNQKLICEYLLSGNYPRNGQTFFTGIYEVLPGHFIKISDSPSLKQKPYCTFPVLKFDDYKKDNIKREYTELFNQTIKKFIPQSKFAISVSGGLDSTLLTRATIKNLTQKDYELYSVVCEGANYKEAELPYIQEYEKYINEDIHYLVAPLPPKWGNLKDYLEQTSEPAAILNYYMSYLISQQLEKANIKFILLGNGADVFMLGTMDDQIQYLEYLWKHKKLLVFFRECLAFFVKQDYTDNIIERISSNIKYYFNRLFSKSQLNLLNPVFLKNNFKEKAPNVFDIVADMLQFSDNFDRVYASRGIEVSSPFLDKRLVKYTAELPSHIKIRWGVRKYLLREVAKGLVPESIRKCKRKFPSTIPLSSWLIAWKDEINNLLNSEKFSKRPYYNARLRARAPPFFRYCFFVLVLHFWQIP